MVSPNYRVQPTGGLLRFPLGDVLLEEVHLERRETHHPADARGYASRALVNSVEIKQSATDRSIKKSVKRTLSF